MTGLSPRRCAAVLTRVLCAPPYRRVAHWRPLAFRVLRRTGGALRRTGALRREPVVRRPLRSLLHDDELLAKAGANGGTDGAPGVSSFFTNVFQVSERHSPFLTVHAFL